MRAAKRSAGKTGKTGAGASGASVPNKLLTIDPGKDLGWALWQGGELAACGLGTFPGDCADIDRLVVERPHTGHTRARKQDVITLAIRAGEVAGIMSFLTGVPPEYLEPNRWKGSQSKEISARVTQSKLRPQELALFEEACRGIAEGKRHNVLDAIGIGLYVLKR